MLSGLNPSTPSRAHCEPLLSRLSVRRTAPKPRGFAAPRSLFAPLLGEKLATANTASSAPPACRLLTSYAETLAALLACVDSAVAGDALFMRVYVLEDGASSQAVLAALRRAAARGVAMRLGCDRGPLSAITRTWERSRTLSCELAELAHTAWPAPVEVEDGIVPDHGKVLVHRCAAHPEQSLAILGGANIGDRFAGWADVSVRMQGAECVAQLAAALRLPPAFVPPTAAGGGGGVGVSFAANVPASFCPLRFALRVPLAGRFDVAPALAAFYADASIARYVAVSAYIDGKGAKLLLSALRRGADVMLLTPRDPNVYVHSNRAALRALLRAAAGLPGRLSLRLFHGAPMLHAKAGVGICADGSVKGYLGSANLKERSLTQFGEVVCLLQDGSCSRSLKQVLQAYAVESVAAPSPRHIGIYDPAMAGLEEYCG